MSLVEDLLETWEIHNRIHLYLLEAVAEESLGSTAASKGRKVGEQFAHIHNVRLMWLKSADRELLEGLSKVEGKKALDKALLGASLEASSRRILELLRTALEEGGRVKGFKPHPAAFLGYLISHESHHRGQIALSLKQAEVPVERKVSYGLWEWGSR